MSNLHKEINFETEIYGYTIDENCTRLLLGQDRCTLCVGQALVCRVETRPTGML